MAIATPNKSPGANESHHDLFAVGGQLSDAQASMQPHGEGHKGDLPALTVDASGKSTKRVVAPHLKLTDAKGRSIMIHAGGDNYSDQPAPWEAAALALPAAS
jgi:Cu-Zn family superoxide dismutase